MAQMAGGRRLLRVVAVGVGLTLVAAGCGTRWDHDQREEMTARYSQAKSSGASDDAAADEGSSDGATGDGVSTDGGGSGDGATVTTTAGSGGSGGTGGAVSAANLPCSAPSQAPGVTADSITIGTVSSLSGPVPGLGESSLQAVRAYVTYLNSIGGVCGRQAKMKPGDDGGDNAQNRAVVAQMEPQVLGLVGGAAGGSAGSEDVIAAKKVPSVLTVIGAAFMQRVPNVFGTNPPFPNVNTVIGKYRHLYDQGVRKVALVYVNAQASPEEIRTRQRPLMEAAGIKVVLDLATPLTTLSYDSAARAVANSGADYMFFQHEAGASAAMARSIADTGYKLKFAEYVTAYGSNFIELAGAAAEGSVGWTRSLPAEDRGKNAELDSYLTWMAKAAPNAAVDGFAADAWVAAKAFFDALKALKGPITRDAVTAQLAATDAFNAGGFFGEIRLGPKQAKGCQVGMIVRGGKWQRLTPGQGFLC